MRISDWSSDVCSSDLGVIPLERYVIDGMMTSAQAGFLVRAVRERQNVLIAGATSSGKTTLANALLAEIAATGDRVLVLEDTVELPCAARDHVPQIGRASCRERVCQYFLLSVVPVSIKKNYN